MTTSLTMSLDVRTKVYAETWTIRPTSKNLVYDTITSDETRRVMEIVFYVVLNGILSVLGVAANVINIVVFVKQGFNDSINISLCGLAVSDVCSLLLLVWTSICFNPLFRYSGVGLDTVKVYEVTAGWSRVCFIRINSLITAFITFERCVCIALPLKVKDIITPRRTFIAIVTIFILMIALVCPIFTTFYFGTVFNIQRNASIVGVLHVSNTEYIEEACFSVNISVQFCSVFIVIVCTVNIIYNLLSNSQWRRQLADSSLLSNSVSSRDKRVMKMVSIISSIFIATFLPNAFNVIFRLYFKPDYGIGGRYNNTFLISWCIINTVEAINSTVNILVYYKMSSKFRNGVNTTICVDRNGRPNNFWMNLEDN